MCRLRCLLNNSSGFLVSCKRSKMKRKIRYLQYTNEKQFQKWQIATSSKENSLTCPYVRVYILLKGLKPCQQNASYNIAFCFIVYTEWLYKWISRMLNAFKTMLLKTMLSNCNVWHKCALINTRFFYFNILWACSTFFLMITLWVFWQITCFGVMLQPGINFNFNHVTWKFKTITDVVWD